MVSGVLGTRPCSSVWGPDHLVEVGDQTMSLWLGTRPCSGQSSGGWGPDHVTMARDNVSIYCRFKIHCAHTHTHTHVLSHAHMHTHIHTHMYSHTHTCTHITHTHVLSHAHMHTHYTHTHTHTTHTHMHTYTHAHTYTHTPHTHTYTHTTACGIDYCTLCQQVDGVSQCLQCRDPLVVSVNKSLCLTTAEYQSDPCLGEWVESRAGPCHVIFMCGVGSISCDPVCGVGVVMSCDICVWSGCGHV